MSVAVGLRSAEADSELACLRKSRRWQYLANSDLVAAKVGVILHSTCVFGDSTSVAIRSEFSSFAHLVQACIRFFFDEYST